MPHTLLPVRTVGGYAFYKHKNYKQITCLLIMDVILLSTEENFDNKEIYYEH